MKTIKLITEDSYLKGYNEFGKLCCHIPINGAPVLEGIDLLPPFSRHQENDVEQLSSEYSAAELSIYPDKSSEFTDDEINILKAVIKAHSYRGFKKGYNKAREVFIKRIEEEILNNPYYKDSPRLKEGAMIVKVMLESTNQYPTAFECEMVDFEVDMGLGEECVEYGQYPKTTTINGHIVWVGKYIY